MQIAIASGKGGTGKTTIATSLAKSLVGSHKVHYLDCDVEAPNGHLFLHPDIQTQKDAIIRIPQIDTNLCTLCGRCVEVCQFHALAQTADEIVLFPELCHGCGSCTWNCPEDAITEIANPIGIIESGITPDGINFCHGVLKISEPMPTPIIRQMRKYKSLSRDSVVILDAPPGASCSVVETLRAVDYAILVTEPSPFGKHDLLQIFGILKDLKIPAGVIINRTDGHESDIEQLILEKQIPILMQIPFDKSIAAGIASGRTLVELQPEYRERFIAMFDFIESFLAVEQVC
ncbi:MAG: (4Fe-4S)-binding protein [Chloroflexi bacterium 44-23]|nr:MAG: (4Fe-4S)-binding protein [Chloroflexi bacterium 44-23]